VEIGHDDVHTKVGMLPHIQHAHYRTRSNYPNGQNNYNRTLAKKGPWAVHLIGSELEGGPIFQVSVSQLHTKEIRTVAVATIELSLVQARLPIEREGGRLSSRYFAFAVDSSHIKWTWL
jgi:hypothetical protein